ncbi:helix-turn-helix domain-containing protein [Rhizobium ruizarguesonis]
MESDEFRAALTVMGVNQGEFAQMVGVTVGAVSHWLSGVRPIPGPVEAFVSLFMRLPSSVREFELSQLRKGTSQMRNGMYLIHFTGSDGDGYATLTFHDGRVYGFDTGGGIYDGICAPGGLFGTAVEIKVDVRMPANVPSVVGGITYPFEWVLPVRAQMSLADDKGSIAVYTDHGPMIRADFIRMRDLPALGAAA